MAQGFNLIRSAAAALRGDKSLGFKRDMKLSAAMGGMRVWNLPMNCKPRAALWDTQSTVQANRKPEAAASGVKGLNLVCKQAAAMEGT